MKVFDRYFSKNPPVIVPDFSDTLSLIVTIPVYDDPDIFFTIDSLAACSLTSGPVGVIVLVNYAEDCGVDVKKRNDALYVKLLEYVSAQPDTGMQFRICRAFDLPAKQSGVGVARKIAMDAAARYFYDRGLPDGVIASLDADTLVEKNYCTAVSEAFRNNNRAGVALAYKHIWPENIKQEQLAAMCRYELYLRYYRMCLEYIGHPYAYTCLGSAFAVRALDYAAEGGMSKRQAGEDFYFIQKLIATGRFARLPATCVFPAARLSERTPFGTGQAVRQIMETGGHFNTYHLEAFQVLKVFFDSVASMYCMTEAELTLWIGKQPESLRAFLSEHDFENRIAEVKANSASDKQFRKRFFDNFNAFRVLKYLNYVHPVYWEKQEITVAASCLLKELYPEENRPADIFSLLDAFREKDV